jgi:hypothetical protein
MVNFWADQGATSFKAYMNITRDELRAAVEEAHKRGLKVTAISARSVIAKRRRSASTISSTACLPIRNSFLTSNPTSVPQGVSQQPAPTRSQQRAAAQETIRTLVAKNVAITSTLPVFEAGGAPLTQTGIGASECAAESACAECDVHRRARALPASASARLADSPSLRWFARRWILNALCEGRRLLIAGLDPTGNGGIVAGFGDLREVEVAGRSRLHAVEAIKIASSTARSFSAKTRASAQSPRQTS